MPASLKVKKTQPKCKRLRKKKCQACVLAWHLIFVRRLASFLCLFFHHFLFGRLGHTSVRRRFDLGDGGCSHPSLPWSASLPGRGCHNTPRRDMWAVGEFEPRSVVPRH